MTYIYHCLLCNQLINEQVKPFHKCGIPNKIIQKRICSSCNGSGIKFLFDVQERCSYCNGKGYL